MSQAMGVAKMDRRKNLVHDAEGVFVGEEFLFS